MTEPLKKSSQNLEPKKSTLSFIIGDKRECGVSLHFTIASTEQRKSELSSGAVF